MSVTIATTRRLVHLASLYLSLLIGMLLKDRLKDYSNLLIPDAGRHVFTVAHPEVEVVRYWWSGRRPGCQAGGQGLQRLPGPASGPAEAAPTAGPVI